MSKVKTLIIKPWERPKYPNLKTKTELQKLKLMPKYNVKPRALVDRPPKYGGDYYLYDETLTMPYHKSQRQKEEEKKLRLKKRAEYTCQLCNEYIGIKNVKTGLKRMWGHLCENCYFSQFRAVNKEKIICFDLETTGLYPWHDEILQLAIIDGNGKILFNHYIKPEHTSEWEQAQEVNGITPEMVQNEYPFTHYIEEIQHIIDNSELLIGYNHDSFDIPFLQSSGIIIKEKETFDVMTVFAEIYGDWDYKRRRYRYPKLTRCANYYGYVNNGAYHDALEDTRATLFCFFEITKER